jgi:hypothetical protein
VKPQTCVIAASLGVLAACHLTPLESAAGRHVVVHWNPDELPLCGGTIAHIDASLEIMAETYGVRLPSQPNIEIFWTSEYPLANSACSFTPVSTAAGCAPNFPNGAKILISQNVVDEHELTHTVSLAKSKWGLPSFFAEGVAGRWEHGLGDISVGKSFYIGDVSHAEVLSMLERYRVPPEAYPAAGFLWSWLESEFGPAAMKEFAGRIDLFSSPAKIEREFEATFGITLETATEASRGQPLIAFDPHPCFMALPTLTWAEEPLVFSAGPSTCAADDVVNSGRGPARFVRLELPDVWQDYSLEVSGPMWSSEIHFYRCRGEPLPYEEPVVLHPKGSDWPISLSGTYIVIVTALIEQNGDIPFPTASLKP